jgi:hypothetical protein
MRWRRATADDVDVLAPMNARLIQDEGHRNSMTVPELAGRMADGCGPNTRPCSLKPHWSGTHFSGATTLRSILDSSSSSVSTDVGASAELPSAFSFARSGPLAAASFSKCS